MKKYLLILGILIVTSTAANAAPAPNGAHHHAMPPQANHVAPAPHHGSVHSQNHILVHPRRSMPSRHHGSYSVWWNYPSSRYYHHHYVDCMCYECRKHHYGYGTGININLRF